MSFRAIVFTLLSVFQLGDFTPNQLCLQEKPSSVHLTYVYVMLAKHYPPCMFSRRGQGGGIHSSRHTEHPEWNSLPFPPTASPPLELSSHFLAMHPSLFACSFSCKVSVLSYQTFLSTDSFGATTPKVLSIRKQTSYV